MTPRKFPKIMTETQLNENLLKPVARVLEPLERANLVEKKLIFCWLRPAECFRDTNEFLSFRHFFFLIFRRPQHNTPSKWMKFFELFQNSLLGRIK